MVEESLGTGVYVDNARVTCLLGSQDGGIGQGNHGNSGQASAAIEAAMALNAGRMGGHAKVVY